ncbi:MAG TPA: ester cyclase [Gaiellaceae bacterium]|nr:ester cyclase [Gaiellaceae bacterium]
MSRLSAGRRAAAAVGVLASLAGAASFVRGWRRRKGNRTDVKNIARRLAEDPWRGKLDEVLDLIGEGFVGHVPGSPEPLRGKQGFREFATTYLSAFPDGTLTVDDQIAEGNMFATRWTGRGTHTGELMGVPATGRQVTISGITYGRIVDGKAWEAWSIWDTLSLLQQLGVIPEMIAAPRSP